MKEIYFKEKKLNINGITANTHPHTHPYTHPPTHPHTHPPTYPPPHTCQHIESEIRRIPIEEVHPLCSTYSLYLLFYHPFYYSQTTFPHGQNLM